MAFPVTPAQIMIDEVSILNEDEKLDILDFYFYFSIRGFSDINKIFQIKFNSVLCHFIYIWMQHAFVWFFIQMS